MFSISTFWRAGGAGAALAIGLFLGRGLASAAEAPVDTVYLSNGDRLQGELVVLDPQKGLQWRHPDIREPVSFKYDAVVKLALGDRSFKPLAAQSQCRVRLTNGDELEGNLQEMTAQQVVLDTWYAGPLTIARKRIDSLIPIVVNPQVVFEGPTGLEGWTIGANPIAGVASNGWTYSHGTFASSQSASIARDLKLPDIAALDFDVAWNNYLSIAVAIYADSLQPIQLMNKDVAPDFGGFYSLQLNYNTVNLMMVKKGAPLNSLGLGFVPGLEQRTSCHVSIRANKKDRMIYLYIDGAMVKQWQDPLEFAGQGTCVRFVNQVQAGLKLSNLQVSHWDGRMETPTNKVENAQTDFVRMLNQDTIQGAVQSFRAGSLKIAAPFGPVEVPLDRVAQLHFAAPGREVSQSLPGDARAQFARRGQVTGRFEQWQDGGLVVSNASFGKARFAVAAFKSFQLRPGP
jgi:hypothetical protein